MNPLDRIVSWWSPQLGLRRVRARAILEATRSAYEGASVGRRTGGWLPAGGDPNTIQRGELARLRFRSRDLRRNNPFASRAVSAIANNIVGYGITPTPVGRTKTQKRRAKEKWEAWANSTDCDFGGQLTLPEQIQLAAETIVDSGEVIIRRRHPRVSDGLDVPLQIQILEPDHLDDHKDGAIENRLAKAGRFVQGIEIDGRGRRQHYWLFPDHPGLDNAWRSLNSEPVPAHDIAHGYRVDRPGQMRGVPWSAPVLLRLRNYDETEDAYIERQKIAACFSVFLYDDDPMGAAKQAGGAEMIERIEPGTIQRLPPGLRAEFANPGGVDGYREFADVNLHAIAAGYGVPYEVLTGDFSQVNFSSARMGWLEFQRSLERWRWQMVIPQLMERIWQWFIEAGIVAGHWDEQIPAEWTAPRREMIDPVKETRAAKDAVRSGMKSWQETLREMGYDPDQVAKELAEDRDLFDQLGLILDIDPRHSAAPGSPRTTPQEATNDGPANDDD